MSKENDYRWAPKDKGKKEDKRPILDNNDKGKKKDKK